jgi:hypothetical protein
VTSEERDAVLDTLQTLGVGDEEEGITPYIHIGNLQTVLDEMVEKSQFKHGEHVAFFVGKVPALVHMGWNCPAGKDIAMDLMILCRNRVNELREADTKPENSGTEPQCEERRTVPRNERRCYTCDFYEASGITHRGRCRRYPPLQEKVSGPGIDPVAPITRSFEWCGEWKQAQVDPEPIITPPSPDPEIIAICSTCEHQRGAIWVKPYAHRCPAYPTSLNFQTGVMEYPLCKDSNPDGNCKLYEEAK